MISERLEFVKKAAISVGNELLDHFHNGNREAQLKSDRTLVTEADHKADQLLQEMIKKSFPSDGVLSEESSTIYPDNEHVWIIDPLDGTVNFSLGLHYWGVSISHLESGQPHDAALYFPVIDELYSATAGAGAELNGKPLLTSNPPVKSHYPVFSHCSRMQKHYQVNLPYKKRVLGSAAYSQCLIPKGTAILSFESTPKIWDLAASWLIVEESGGIIRVLEGQQPFPAQPGIDYIDQSYSVISAGSEDVIKKAVAGIVRR